MSIDSKLANNYKFVNRYGKSISNIANGFKVCQSIIRLSIDILNISKIANSFKVYQSI